MKKGLMTAMLLAWCLVHVGAASPLQASLSSVRYVNDRLSLDVRQESFFSVLERVSKLTGIRFFISEEIKPAEVNVFVNRKPLQEGLRKVLRDYNFAMIFTKSDQDWRVASVEIYPRGKQSGLLKPLGVEPEIAAQPQGGGKRVLVTSTKEVVTYGKLEDRGLLQPSRITPLTPQAAQAVKDEAWFLTGKQLEARELEAYQELLYAKKRIESVSDPDRKSALQAVYSHKLKQFYEQKKSNTNTIEAMKRIGIFQKMSQPEK